VTTSIFDELVGALRAVTGEDAAWADAVGPASRLDGDLRLDSIELAALDQRLRDRHGDRVDLMGLLAGLELDQLIALTVDDVARYVASHVTQGGRR
jgi:acyl carrier protein